MSDPVQRLGADDLREERLLEIRRHAKRKGRMEAAGIRPGDAPLPVASPETGYYGLPLLKQPAWSWQIPLYFFIGGATGSVAVIGPAARWIGRDLRLARNCRYLAAAGTAASTALLITDLGRPSRFLAMMRVFKKQSPMSVGAWTLAAFGTFAAAAGVAEVLDRRFPSMPLRILGDLSEGISALAGLPFSNYTGVLIAASVIPVWNENVGTLPIHFGMSGLNTAVSILELMGHENRALNTLGMGASTIETLQGLHIESTREPVTDPLRRGCNGLVTRLGGVMSGPVPLLLRVAAGFAGRSRSRQLRRAAAVSSIVGSMLTRIAWMQAGRISAADWRLPLETDKAQARKSILGPSGSGDTHKTIA